MRIVIPGPPIAKARPKFTTRGRFPCAYDSQAKESHALRNWLSALIMRDAPLNELEYLAKLPLDVTMYFDMAIPESSTESHLRAKLWGFEIPSQKDIDNCVKYYFDILSGIVWNDDRMIVKLKAEKKYSENPCTIIEIIPIDTSMDKQTQAIIKLFSPDEMYQFRCDASLLANSIEEMKAAMVDDQALFLPPVAKQIIDFSKKYSKKLSKLAKENGS